MQKSNTQKPAAGAQPSLSQEQKELVHARTEKKIDQLVEDKLRSRPANVPPVQQKAQGTQQ